MSYRMRHDSFSSKNILSVKHVKSKPLCCIISEPNLKSILCWQRYKKKIHATEPCIYSLTIIHVF